MAEERKGAVTMRGNPLTLVGAEVKAGQKAPEFHSVDKAMQPIGLDKFKGKVKVISVIPSIDTPVCDAQTRRFNEEASKLGDVQILTVSMDLPFAQARWCGAAGVDKITMVSDFKDPHDFGNKYGVLIKELGLLARAVFVVDKNDNVTHAEYVKEVASHPDYEATLAAAKKAAAA